MKLFNQESLVVIPWREVPLDYFIEVVVLEGPVVDENPIDEEEDLPKMLQEQAL